MEQIDYERPPGPTTIECTARSLTSRYEAAGLTPPDFRALENGELPCITLGIIDDNREMSLPGILINDDADLTILARNFGSIVIESQPIVSDTESDHSGSSESTHSSLLEPKELPIFHPMTTSTDYYWFGHSSQETTWMLKQHVPFLPFFPFCEIESFDVIWRSELDENGLRCYLLKPIPICTNYYKSLGYCVHIGINPRPDMTKEPWNLLRAVKISLLEAVPYKANLMWLDTSSTRPCSIWRVMPRGNVLPPDLFYVCLENMLPDRMWLIKQGGIKIPEWASSLVKSFKFYDTYDSDTAFDSVKDMDRNLTSHLIKLLRSGNAAIKWFAAKHISDIAKYSDLREDILPSISQLGALRCGDNPYLVDIAEISLSKLANYRK